MKLSQASPILLVEDNLINQKVACLSLKSLDIDCIVATTGEEAIEILEEQSFNIILMDCRLPGIDGPETCQRIRQIEKEKASPKTYIIGFSAGTSNSLEDWPQKSRIDAVLPKPFRIEDLEEKIRNALQSREA
ncbi:MAG: response regulator [Puniceicoccaceae bacterium]